MKKSVLFQGLLLFSNNLLYLCLSQQCDDDVYVNCITFNSCQEILAKFPDTPSGYYVLSGSTEKVYCDMENGYCGSKGWARVAYINMSAPTQDCPGNLTLIEEPIRSCGGPPSPGCASATFSTHGIKYSQVCGKLEGYQVGNANAFGPYVNKPDSGVILDGIEISHGENSKKHIWAYVTGYQRNPQSASTYYCPCADYRFSGVVPPPIENHYYCDSGIDGKPQAGKFYTDPLWTGQDCEAQNLCCNYSGMPLFCRSLYEPTTDDIELQNCHNEPSSAEDTAVALIELYVR